MGVETKTKTDRKRKNPYYHYLALFVYQLVKTGVVGCSAGVLLCMRQCFGSGSDPDSIGSADPDPNRLKLAQKRKILRNFMFEESECPL